jgi:hypothetical protein
MSLARHPTWVKIRNTVFEPPLFVAFFTRMVFPISVMYFTRNPVLMMAAILGPYVIVGAIDIYCRTQFSLRSLLLAIVTLQIPVAILFTATSVVAIWIGVALLLIWLWRVGNRIEREFLKQSSQGERWKRIEPAEIAPNNKTSAD